MAVGGCSAAAARQALEADERDHVRSYCVLLARHCYTLPRACLLPAAGMALEAQRRSVREQHMGENVFEPSPRGRFVGNVV